MIPQPPRGASEAAWQAAILQLARLHGWLAYHTHDARKSEEGFPDIIAVRGDRCLAIELKVGKRGVTDAQHTWLNALEDVPGISSHIWRLPGDWNHAVDALLPPGWIHRAGEVWMPGSRAAS